MPFVSEANIPGIYKGEPLDATCRADFVCLGGVLVEVKAQHQFGGPEHVQVINYLVAGDLPVGLLPNFGERPLGIRRYAGPRNFRASAKGPPDAA